ncbi:coenzyme Q-binding protein COQ10 [Loktanella sp. DSM 29012]|uniref:Type II toxin-antitoxin system RatA family toxin n=1 Tax=Loktanella gaetbuli TaxID=2881335 RepID=A0ABS8BQB9_9RHOB|nr:MULTISPECIES: type II toxin-antitoxin system RatA family toxin [Loktanella]KQI69618.1 cyclase [Loktanella sp. 3ANDIMAR09]MCB5197804.1 type II toxin-antitoxin system RatA family toxin [Loktanella gaetbuli]SEQ15744.1 coenzyme Q-binding protein COQ10 [Loktanella sp. DSM 29012]
MPVHDETRVLPYTPQQMFDLVADVESYPKFLPWTAAARLRDRTTFDDRVEILADLVVSFKVFRETFGSRVTLWPAQKAIDTQYIDGPFKHLNSRWEFSDAPEGCKVHFHVDFEFKNRLLQGAAGMFFNQAMQTIVKAFERRAAALYGTA